MQRTCEEVNSVILLSYSLGFYMRAEGLEGWVGSEEYILLLVMRIWFSH